MDTDKYKILFKQMENDYREVFSKLGLDKIININRIKSPIYDINTDHKSKGCFDPENGRICMEKELLDEYFKSLYRYFEYSNSQMLYYIFFNQILLYRIFFHLYTHYVRWVALYEQNNIPYHQYPKDKLTEEVVTEAISILLLSTKYGKETIKYILEEIINNASSIYGLEYHYVGNLLAYILLDIDENEQKKYAEKLIQITTPIDLMELLYNLKRDLPKNKEIYYNLLINLLVTNILLETLYNKNYTIN